MAAETSPSLKTRVLAAVEKPTFTMAVVGTLILCSIAWGWSVVQALSSSVNGAPAIHTPTLEQPGPTAAEQIAEGVKAAEAKRPVKAQKAPALPKPTAPAPAKAPAGAQTIEKSAAPVWGTTDLDRDIENFTPTSAFKGETR